LGFITEAAFTSRPVQISGASSNFNAQRHLGIKALLNAPDEREQFSIDKRGKQFAALAAGLGSQTLRRARANFAPCSDSRNNHCWKSLILARSARGLSMLNV
jgi:hypothetical protein